MKKTIILGLITILLVPLLVMGCGAGTKTTIELSLDDFAKQNNMVKNITVSPHGIITVTLGSNASTGYQWGEAAIGDTSKVAEATRQFVEPTQEGIAGAPGKDVWTFDAKAAGSTTITFSYSRPWEGGEQDTYTLTINVTVK
ncbi:MAG: protease inhibitor I42 family protein [Dehalococcoidales bacterium]|jgi:predicted secreted protein